MAVRYFWLKLGRKDEEENRILPLSEYSDEEFLKEFDSIKQNVKLM